MGNDVAAFFHNCLEFWGCSFACTLFGEVGGFCLLPRRIVNDVGVWFGFFLGRRSMGWGWRVLTVAVH